MPVFIGKKGFFIAEVTAGERKLASGANLGLLDGGIEQFLFTVCR